MVWVRDALFIAMGIALAVSGLLLMASAKTLSMQNESIRVEQAANVRLKVEIRNLRKACPWLAQFERQRRLGYDNPVLVVPESDINRQSKITLIVGGIDEKDRDRAN